MTKTRGVIAVMVAVLAAACQGGSPTGPATTSLAQTGATSPAPSNRIAIEVTGRVTDAGGIPIVGAEVTMRHYFGGQTRSPSVQTDASGSYTLTFTADPLGGNAGGAARAEIRADGYDWYNRTVPAVSAGVENFRLQRITRVTAGGSAVVSVTSENGDCLGWLYGPCGRLRIVPPAGGTLTVEAVATEEGATAPALEVCCVDGNEVYGNPVTLSATAGTELWVEVGQSRDARPSRSVLVTTSHKQF
jgi:hypothetical protein